jgi:cytochrome b
MPTSLVRVWDLPTRLFHWLLASAVIALFVTAKMGAMDWHFRLAYATLTLLLFRLVWGLVGGHWSRFRAFVYSPSTLIRYLKGQGTAAHEAGHTPTGALSVFALLLLLLIQVGTGLFSDDEIAASGPLTALVSEKWVSLASWWHTSVGQPALIALVVAHIAAIAYYHWRKHVNLVRPMITGDKTLDSTMPASRDDAGRRILALVIVLVCSAAVWLLLRLAP